MILHYENALNTLYGGNIGSVLYPFAERLCREAFKNEISPEVPIILTTALSPYNRACAWYCRTSHTIEIVRHHCEPDTDGIVVRSIPEILETLAHEFCHVYQEKVLGGWTGSRGTHRCKSWYQAITLASPFVCGVDIEGLCKPLKSVRIDGAVRKRANPKSLSEVELYHFPGSIFRLINESDARLEDRIIGESAIYGTMFSDKKSGSVKSRPIV
jgi:hypothetical protein